MSTSARPKVRGACEYCHRRKIRCIISPGDTACQNCAHNGATCLFAPRSKPGRPRRFPSDVGSVSESSNSWTRGAGTDSITHSPLHSPSLSDPSGRSDTTLEAHFDLPLPEFDQWLSNDATDGVWTPDECTTTTSGPESWALGYFNPLPPALAMDPTAFLSQRGSDHSPGKLPISPPASARHTPPSAAAPELMDIFQDGAFTSTLETCKRLDEYCRRVENQQHPVLSADDDTLAFAGKICGEAQSRAFEPHSADGALLLAAVLKVLELCGLIFRKFLCGPASARNDQQLLLLKRLDLLLLQAKIFLVQAKQKPGVLKAVEIHNSIDATIRNDFPSLTWGDAGFSGD